MDAAIYSRISEDDGTALGVARQEADCHREAERRGWDVVEVFQDNDVSATRSKARPAYERMLAAIRAGRVQGIVVWDVDRLTRTPRELEDVIDLADQRGLALANVGGEIDLSTPQGRMTARIKGTVARHEAEQMSRRLKRKFLERAEAGKPHGQVPYGFRRVDGRDVAEPAEAAVVVEAARRILDGESLRSIVGELNARGIPGPRSDIWSSSILRQMMVRPSLAGLRQYRGKVLGTATSEPIISVEMHERLVALLTDPSRRSNQAGSECRHLLSGIAKCGRDGCAGVMRRLPGREVPTASGGTKRQPDAYGCNTCFKIRRKQDDVDARVEEFVLARLAEPDAADLFQTGDPAEARAARERIAEIDAKLELNSDEDDAGLITHQQFLRKNARFLAERKVVERQLRSALPTLVMDFDFTDVMGSWDLKTIQQKRAMLEALGVEVTILPSGSGRRFDPELVKVKFPEKESAA